MTKCHTEIPYNIFIIIQIIRLSLDKKILWFPHSEIYGCILTNNIIIRNKTFVYKAKQKISIYNFLHFVKKSLFLYFALSVRRKKFDDKWRAEENFRKGVARNWTENWIKNTHFYSVSNETFINTNCRYIDQTGYDVTFTFSILRCRS